MRNGSETAGGATTDELYLHRRALAGASVLARDAQIEFSRRLHRERQQFVEAAREAPEIVAALLVRWRDLRAAKRSTAVLSVHHVDGGGPDLGREIDRALGRAERLFASPRRSSALAHRRRVARALAEAELAVEAILQAFREAGRATPAPASPEYAAAAEAFAAYVAAREVLVSHNLRLVVRFARPFRSTGVPLADLVQEGTLGLMRAVEKFDPERGLAFSTYAAWWIHQAMIRAVQKESRTIRLPAAVWDAQIRMRRADHALRARTACEPSRDDVGEVLGLPPEESDRIVAGLLPIASTHEPIAGSDWLALEDTLVDETAEDPALRCDHRVLASALPAMLAPLEERERAVLEARFGLGGSEAATLSQVGARLGLSRERVRQIESRALERIRLGPVARGLTSQGTEATSLSKSPSGRGTAGRRTASCVSVGAHTCR